MHMTSGWMRIGVLTLTGFALAVGLWTAGSIAGLVAPTTGPDQLAASTVWPTWDPGAYPPSELIIAGPPNDGYLADPARMPACHVRARQHVADTYGIPIDSLIVGETQRLSDGRYAVDDTADTLEFPHLGITVCAVSVLAIQGDAHFYFGIDEAGAIVDIGELQAADRAALLARCGKFDEPLCDWLDTIQRPVEVRVVAALTDTVPAEVQRQLETRFADVFDVPAGSPINGLSPDYPAMLTEREALLDVGYRAQYERWMALLARPGITIRPSPSYRLPFVSMSVTGAVRAILDDLARIAEVTTLFLEPPPATIR